MADNNLNPGQQQYENLVSDSQAGLRDFEQDAASGYSRDYSTPVDNSVGASSGLRGLEQSAQNRALATSGGNNATRDIGEQERSASFETSNFDGSLNKSSLNNRQKQRLSGFKKKALGGALALIVSGSLMFAGFTVISGPMQLVQAAEVLEDFQLGVTTAQQTARAFKSAKSIANLAKKSLTNNVETSRLGILGKKQADIMDARLKSNGVSLNTNFAGYQSGGIDIDVSKYLGVDNPTDAQITGLAEEMGLETDKYKIVDADFDGSGTKKVLSLTDDLDYSQAKRVIKTLDDPGKWSISGWMQGRVTLKKLGYVSWLHPFEKIKTKAYKSLSDFIDAQISKIEEPDNATEKIKDQAEKDADEANAGKKEDGSDIVPGDKDYRNPDVDTAVDEIGDTLKAEKNGSGKRNMLKKFTSKIDLPSIHAGATVTLPVIGAIAAVVSTICMIQDLTDENGSYKMQNIANTAEKGASQIIGYGSQVKSGEDIDMEAAGMAVEMAMGDTITEVDETGAEIGESYSSFWESAPVCSTLGTANCDTSTDNVPGALTIVSDPTHFFPDSMSELNNIIDGLLNNTISDTICGILGPLADFIGSVGDITGTIIGEIVGAFISETDLMANFMSTVLGYLYGTPLDLESATPEDWGAIGMYGGKFMANDQALGIGGRELESQEAIKLNLENRRYLAWEHSRKPLLARIADPSDYSSSINQLARAIRIDSSSQDIGTQLANVLKTFTSAPSVIATASNQLIGGSAYAASTYDYGVPTFAWDTTEMNEITADDTYDIFTNASEAIDLLEGSSADKYYTYAETCLNVDISRDEEHEVDKKDNQEGEWNYVDFENNPSSYCASNATDTNYKRIRLYVMDYFNTVSSACYESGDDSTLNSACDEMGVGTVSSSSSSSAPQDAQTLLDLFEAESNDGDVDGAYGRQCVDLSIWYIKKYTTLNPSTCDGKCFVQKMAEANPGLEISDTPEAPAIFSASAGQIGTTNRDFGHTGVVVKVDSDGTIYTIENGNSSGSFTGKYSKAEYQGARFANLKGYLK